MIEYRITKHNDSILTKMWEENRKLITIFDNKMYFSKSIKSINNKKIYEPTVEFIEFRDRYRKIKKNWLYDQSLIKNYNECVEKWWHKKIMENLENYIKYLEVSKKMEFALMATTYINRKRYLDEWNIVKDMSRNWMNIILREKEFESDIIENIMSEVKVWEAKQKKEMSQWVFENIITYVLSNWK